MVGEDEGRWRDASVGGIGLGLTEVEMATAVVVLAGTEEDGGRGALLMRDPPIGWGEC